MAECDQRLAAHRAALEAGLQRDEVAALVRAHEEAYRDLGGVLGEADPEDRARLYRELGLTLTYDVSKHLLAEMRLDQGVRESARGLTVSVRGGT